MADVYLGRVSRWLEKLFNVKGGPLLVDVDPSLQVQVPFNTEVDQRYLQGWDRFAWTAVTTAVAAQQGAIQLRNPPVSGSAGAIIVLEQVQFYNNAATPSTINVDLVSIGTDLTNANTGFPVDLRIIRNSIAFPSQTSNGADIGTRLAQVVTTNTIPGKLITSVNQEITLLPTHALRLVNQTVNEALVAFWLWRERALEQSELA